MYKMYKLVNNNSIGYIRQHTCKRNLWHWLNLVFNTLDDERLEQFGPDRVCAEWLLRNGAAVMWTGSSKFLRDYNGLPPENVKLFIKEVDATDSSISHYGFNHFAGCNHIDKVILHRCQYLENDALPLLRYLKGTLHYLQVSSCLNITHIGVNSLTNLSNLEILILYNLPLLKDREGVLKHLVKELPKCNVTFK